MYNVGSYQSMVLVLLKLGLTEGQSRGVAESTVDVVTVVEIGHSAFPQTWEYILIQCMRCHVGLDWVQPIYSDMGVHPYTVYAIYPEIRII